jgi:predicted acylesterase/phospholipase RssA
MFFWQLGVLQYLEQMYDLSEVTMVGSSAGSMLSVFAACDVQAQVRIQCCHAVYTAKINHQAAGHGWPVSDARLHMSTPQTGFRSWYRTACTQQGVMHSN